MLFKSSKNLIQGFPKINLKYKENRLLTITKINTFLTPVNYKNYCNNKIADERNFIPPKSVTFGMEINPTDVKKEIKLQPHEVEEARRKSIFKGFSLSKILPTSNQFVEAHLQETCD